MNASFLSVIQALGANFAFRIMNTARPAADYLFNTFLPERLKPSYIAKNGYMTVRATMAGLVGMDSPYPPAGKIDASTFIEKIAKFGGSIPLTEELLRELQDFIARLGGNEAAASAEIQATVLNFTNKLIVQSHLDSMEYLRGQCLLGAIDWTYNKIHLAVSYGIPSSNILTSRTGNDGYGGSTSKFWEDQRAARRALKGQIRAQIAHPDTIDMIAYNPANNVRLIAQDDSGSVTLGKLVGANLELSSDTRDRATLIAYASEGEIIDPNDETATKLVPFMATGKIITVGRPPAASFQIGMGSTRNPQSDLELGYTHIGPTIEGNSLGRWARVYTPEGQPWSLVGQGVTNGLPVLESPEKVVISTTAMV